jgi:hypothetical protein
MSPTRGGARRGLSVICSPRVSKTVWADGHHRKASSEETPYRFHAGPEAGGSAPAVSTYLDLLDRHGFLNVGSFELTPMHAITHGRK